VLRIASFLTRFQIHTGGIQKAINIESRQKNNINTVELEHPNLDNQIIAQGK
jgi:hypothetical protein